MSFSSDCKKELSLVAPEKDCCPLSELGGLYITMGSLNLLGRGKVNVQFSNESMAVCRRAYTLLATHLRLSPQIHYVTKARFGGTRAGVLTLGPVQSPILLEALGMMTRHEDGTCTLRATTPRLSLTRGCCMRAFLRGVMLGGGTMTSPGQGYHLELPYRDEDARAMIAKCLQKVGVSIHQGTRKDRAFFYVKQSDQLVALLTAMGAHNAVMRIEELRVQRQVLGAVNRAMNCDNANLQKQMDASAQQLEAIRRLKNTDKLRSLPPSLQQIALARLEAPDANLAQLGAMLDPPISKSGVNHRMRRLMTYLEE